MCIGRETCKAMAMSSSGLCGKEICTGKKAAKRYKPKVCATNDCKNPSAYQGRCRKHDPRKTFCKATGCTNTVAGYNAAAARCKKHKDWHE